MRAFVNIFIVMVLSVAFTVAHPQQKEVSDTNQIPHNIMEALKAKFPAPEIQKWTKEKEGEIFVYDIEFKQEGMKFEVDIKEDGTIHNWELAIAIKDLPAAVTNAVEKAYPKSHIEEVMQITAMKEGKDVMEGYEIVLKTNKKIDVELTVATDGKILEDSTTKK